MNVGCRGSSAAEAIPRWPALAATVRAREAEELAALLRDPPKLAADLVARYKPAPTGFKPSFDHLTNCTVCDNDRRWRASVRAAPLQQAPGAPQLLLDEAPLSDWASVVLELERPRKRRVGFVEASHTSAEPPRASRVKYHFGTGLPGTVLYEDGRFRAWVDQFRQTYHESTDGVRFFAKEGALEWLHPLPADPRAAAGGYRRAAKLLGGRAVAQSTLTVTRDEAAPAAERYKSAFNCIEEKSSNALGHDPRAVDPSLRAGGEWQSTCLGYSADGLHWRPYELQHERGEGLRVCGWRATLPTRSTTTSGAGCIAWSTGGTRRYQRGSTARRAATRTGGARFAACASAPTRICERMGRRALGKRTPRGTSIVKGRASTCGGRFILCR